MLVGARDDEAFEASSFQLGAQSGEARRALGRIGGVGEGLERGLVQHEGQASAPHAAAQWQNWLLRSGLVGVNFPVDTGGYAEAALKGADQMIGAREAGTRGDLGQIKGSCFEQAAGGIEAQPFDELGG